MCGQGVFLDVSIPFYSAFKMLSNDIKNKMAVDKIMTL
jgi:hypothetical protein